MVWVVIAIVVIIVAVCGVYSAKIIGDQVKFKPIDCFEQNFDGHKVRVSDISGDRVQTGISDEWIHFKYLGKATVKHENEFKEGWALEGREWFLKKFPDHAGLTTDLQRLKFYKRVENQRASVQNEWLLYNPRTDDHFYRRWGFQ